MDAACESYPAHAKAEFRSAADYERHKVIVSGLWTGICNNMFALGAMLVRAVPALLGKTDVRGLVTDLADAAIRTTLPCWR